MCFTFLWKRREDKKSGEMGQGDWVLWAVLVEVNSLTVQGYDLGALASGAGTDTSWEGQI